MQTAFCQRQVDRTAAFVGAHARVRSLFEDIHRPAAAGEQGRQQGAGQARARDGDSTAAHIHQQPRQASTARTKRSTSSYLL